MGNKQRKEGTVAHTGHRKGLQTKGLHEILLAEMVKVPETLLKLIEEYAFQPLNVPSEDFLNAKKLQPYLAGMETLALLSLVIPIVPRQLDYVVRSSQRPKVS